MQLTEILIGRAIPPIGGGGSLPIKRIAIGQQCSPAFGGGAVTSITLERGGVVIIRKDRPFRGKAPTDKPFDCVVLLPGGEYAYGVDEKPAEQKQAQQAQQPKGK